MLIDGSGGLAAVANDGDATIETVAEQLKSIDQDIQALYILPDGQQVRGQLRRSFNLVTNYSFDHGPLKGFTFGAGANYRSGEVVNFIVATDSSGNVTTTPVHGKVNTLVSLNAGYKSQLNWLSHKIRWSLQLNVSNAFDEDEIMPTRIVNDIITTYRLQPPRQ